MTAAVAVYALVLGLLLLAAAMCLERAAVLRRVPRRWIWSTALAVMLALTLATPWRAAGGRPAVGHQSVRAGAEPVEPLTWTMVVFGVRDGLSAVAARAAFADRAVAYAWGAMSLGAGLFYIAGCVTLARRRRRWRRGAVRGQAVLVAPDTGPAVVGLVVPAIVLPAWVLDLDRGALDLVLRHEQQHLQARDHWLVHAMAAGVVVMPWNPVVWLMASRLRLAIECDCDTRVLALGRGGTDEVVRYADVLLDIGSRRRGRVPLVAPALIEPSSILSKRIAAMCVPIVRFARVKAVVAALASLLLVVGACGAPAPTAGSSVDGGTATVPTTVLSLDSPGVRRPGPGATNPRVLSESRPGYTAEAMRNRIAGQVKLEALVLEDGSVGDVRVVTSLDQEFGLDANAIGAAKLWRFAPALVDGRPVPMVVTLVMSFSIH